jgi:ATPase subunit of ABC transporter with duplicated ATPase domains
MSPADLLLLDEPTNHLDLEAILWLENWLRQFPGALLIIAHDRAFLDNTVDHVLHLSGEQAHFYRGNYSAFERLRIEELERQQAMAAKQQAQAAHIQQFVDRFRAKASKAKQVQSQTKFRIRCSAFATSIWAMGTQPSCATSAKPYCPAPESVFWVLTGLESPPYSKPL